MQDPFLARQIGTYFIQERLQAGGMAVVYKAFDQDRREVVAFKVLKESFTEHSEIIRRFQREADISRTLTHPHIVPFYDFGEIDGKFYMVMKFMAGGSLADRLRDRANVTLGRTVIWLRQLSGALDFAHKRGVIHRDLKPGNVLMANDDDVYLGDFGIARITEATQLTASGLAMPGTARYMSPEQGLGEVNLDHRSDGYSFGVLAYLLVTGRYPFTGVSDTALIHQHIYQLPPAPTEVNQRLPLGVNDVLLRCLAKDPRRRYDSTSEFVSALEQAIVGYEDDMVIVDPDAANPVSSAVRYAQQMAPPTPSHTPSPTPPSPPPFSKTSGPFYTNPFAWIGVVLALLVVVIGLLVIGGDDEPPAVAADPTDTATATPTHTPTDSAQQTDSAAIATVETPVVGTPYMASDTETPTLSAFQILQTTEAERTHAAETQAATDRMATNDSISNANASATAQQIAATDSAARMTLIALSATPTATPTNTPAPRGYSSDNPVTANNQWTPITQTFDGVEMVLVPAGCFNMGSNDGDSDERPVHEQCFDAPFWIGKTEVTNAQYRLCVAAGACTVPSDTTDYDNLSYNNHPVVYVTWFQAEAYADWLGMRLPTEAEWEYAARGPSNLVYPWGNTFVANNVVYSVNLGYQTANVGSRPGGVSWVGAYDLSGNVWEWVSTIYRSYPYSATDGRESNTDTNGLRVLRGGSWSNVNGIVRAANRFRNVPSNLYNVIGFRCAHS